MLMYNKRKLVGDYKSVKGNVSLTITLDMAWAVSFIANLLKKGTSIMFQICAACVDSLARGQVCLCPCIVASHGICIIRDIASR